MAEEDSRCKLGAGSPGGATNDATARRPLALQSTTDLCGRCTLKQDQCLVPAADNCRIQILVSSNEISPGLDSTAGGLSVSAYHRLSRSSTATVCPAAALRPSLASFQTCVDMRLLHRWRYIAATMVAYGTIRVQVYPRMRCCLRKAVPTVPCTTLIPTTAGAIALLLWHCTTKSSSLKVFRIIARPQSQLRSARQPRRQPWQVSSSNLHGSLIPEP
ncbi:hypothetical protein LIA77_00951 [Sarocladium implicatum]|nr:hypothetical protein LIA77_00951 [Sarocladium implicatum]